MVPGPQELMIILVIMLVLFGGAKLPKLARSLGEAQRELRSAADGESPSAETGTSANPEKVA